MLHLVLCFVIWIVVFTGLFWRLIAIAEMAVRHLQRLHQIPCGKCTYFTGDYRLKCTVNPMVAMSDQAIDCRDFLHDNQRSMCNGCQRRSPKGYIQRYPLAGHLWIWNMRPQAARFLLPKSV